MMKPSFCRFLLLAILLSTLPVRGAAPNSHVVLVSIDGLAAFHLEDSDLVLPNLKELIAEGVRAEGALTVFPSVTHPSHATLVTGVSPRKHGVLGNRMTNRETGESFAVTVRRQDEVLRARTLFEAAAERGLVTAALCWPETRGDSSIEFNLLHGHDELDPAEVDPEFLTALRKAGIPVDSYYEWSQESPMQGFRDTILARAAAWLLRTHRPHLLAVHFLETDSTQHAWGPDHYLSRAALTRADFHLGLLREAVREAGMEDSTTFIIGADHGFHSVHHELNLYPALQRSGLGGRIRLHGSGWTVFLEKTASFDSTRDQVALEAFFENLLELEGVHRIVDPEEFHDLGYPRYEEDPHVAGQFMILPDIDTFLVVNPGETSAERRPRGIPSHGHGYLPEHPRMHPALVLSGHLIRRGERIGVVRNHDVAPTIAEILRLDLSDVEGRVLHEALR